MIQWLRKRLYQYFLKKELRHHKPKRGIISMAEAKEIGIILDATDPTITKLVNQFADSIRSPYRKVFIMAFYDYPKPAINLNFPHFYRKQLNFFMEPQGYLVEEFIDKRFDILINAFLKDSPPLEYIAALSQARYRIGPYKTDKMYCSDVMIDIKAHQGIDYYLEQVKHYLYMIK
jgi:hypothetical protein